MKRVIILLVVVLGVGSLYLINTPRHTFGELYEGTDQKARTSLDSLRALPLKSISVNGQTWRYLSVGQGGQSILFLHGMAGSYDIWWQQVGAFKDRYRIIALTYPPSHSLQAMRDAVIKILDEENISETHVMGSSLGGYFAQFLVTTYPDRFKKAVFGNTFPPNDLYKDKNHQMARMARYLPEWLVMYVFRNGIRNKVVPASEYSPITEAYLMEQSYGGMSKAQFLARYDCVIDKFDPNPELSDTHKILIIESNNDPLIFPELRQRLKEIYPRAKVYTFRGKGHFPYLNEPRAYNKVVADFLSNP